MSEQLKVQGVLHRVSDTQIISEKFKKRDFSIKTEGDYPQFVQFQLSQDKVNLIDSFSPGDRIEIFFNLRGRCWEDKVFNTLDCWKINKV